MEHSDATAENTRWVEVWIINDGDYYFAAQEKAREGADALAAYVTNVLKTAPAQSGAWHTARELSANDYNRIDWAEIAKTLLAE